MEHEKTGLLADFGNKKQLTQYWLGLLQDEQKAHTLAKAGREFVNERFSGKRMAKEYLELFNELI